MTQADQERALAKINTDYQQDLCGAVCTRACEDIGAVRRPDISRISRPGRRKNCRWHDALLPYAWHVVSRLEERRRLPRRLLLLRLSTITSSITTTSFAVCSEDHDNYCRYFGHSLRRLYQYLLRRWLPKPLVLVLSNLRCQQLSFIFLITLLLWASHTRIVSTSVIAFAGRSLYCLCA